MPGRFGSMVWRWAAAVAGAGLLAGAATVLVATAPASAASSFVIGFANPITGSEATYGVSDLNAAQMAANQLNAKGGVDGHKIKLITCDTKGVPATGTACADEFVTDDVNAVIGFFNSSISLPASGILHRAGIPMVSGASTNPQLTEQGFKTVFRVCGTDNYQGLVEAEFAHKVLKDKYAVALNDEETYGEGVANYFAQNFKKEGGHIVAAEGIDATATDYSSVLTQINSLSPKPQVIEFGGFNPAAGLLVKQARGLGMTQTFISDDGVIGPLFYQTGGSATVGSYLSSEPEPQQLPTSKHFVKEYVHKYHAQPTEFAGYVYDCLNVIATAAKSEHGITHRDLVKGLAKIHTYKGVTGVVNFNKIGNNITPQYLMFKVINASTNKVDWNPNAK
ncbi:MAG: branched-chain amino acid ABC transporter substrate-binding protein [Candidatus Dormibacteria bacterium]